MSFAEVKAFKTHGEQIKLLRSRGMRIDDVPRARHVLERVNYYRLSGYWYPFRQLAPRVDSQPRRRLDTFIAGTNLSDVVALYRFDERLRAAVFSELSPIELALRAMLGHELGRHDPLAHLHPESLGPSARLSGSQIEPSALYLKWQKRYGLELAQSHEDFVAHHQQKYGGQLPIWAAVEVMDWGSLTYLYQFAPFKVRDVIAERAGLTAPQLGSWLKCLNILRNYSAHHARMFNRVYALQPRLPKTRVHPELAALAKVSNRCFGQLSLIQHLSDSLGVGDRRTLPRVLASFPKVFALPVAHLGAPDDWSHHPLWDCA